MKSILFVLILNVVFMVNITPLKAGNESRSVAAEANTEPSANSILSDEKPEESVSSAQPLTFDENELQFEEWMKDPKQFKRR